MDPTVPQQGRQRLEEALADLHSDGPLNAYDRYRFAKREMLCIGSLEVLVSVDQQGRTVARAIQDVGRDSLPLFAAQADPRAEQGEGAGALEVYLLPAYGGQVFFVSRGSECVLAEFAGQVPDDVRASLQTLAGNRRVELDASELLESALSSLMASRSTSVVLNRFRETAPPAIRDFYMTTATLQLPEDHLPTAKRALEVGGLWDLLGRDPQLLRGLAIVGCTYGVLTREETIKWLESFDIAFEDLMEAARAARELSGLTLIREVGSSLFASI